MLLLAALVAGLRLGVEVRSALIALFAVLLACCARGMSRQARTGDGRLIVAIATPWAVMFFVMGQMDERYIAWSACLSAGAVAVNGWSVAAHAMLTGAASVTMVQAMLFDRPGVHLGLRAALDAATPLTAVATTAAVVILFKFAMPVGSTAAPARKLIGTSAPTRRPPSQPAVSRLAAPVS